MKLVLKIGIAILLVVVAVLLVIYVRSEMEPNDSQQQRDAAERVMSQLTPEAVIARCGVPWSDRSETRYEDRFENRVLIYDLPATVGRVELTFLLSGNPATPDSSELELMEIKNAGSERIVTDAVERVSALPCLLDTSENSGVQ